MTQPIQLASSVLRQPASDVDLSAFNLEMRNKVGIKLVSAITDAVIDKTIDGASTLTVTVDDDNDHTIQNSGRLGRKVDVKVDGLWWTLAAVKKTGRKLSLTFEEREVNVLRYYNSLLMANRSQVTRAQFALRMIKEPKEIAIKWSIPELDTVTQPSDVRPNEILVTPQGDPIAAPAPDPVSAIPLGTQLTVKGQPATAEQVRNANIILQKGEQMGANRKVLVSSIMTAITESRILNAVGDPQDPAHNDSTGVFQQRKSMGWPATRDIPTDAAAYFQQAIALDRSKPDLPVEMLCQGVQRSAFADGSNYATWQSEGEKFVTEFGVAPTTAPGHYETSTGGLPVGTNNQKDTTTDPVTANQSGQYFFRGVLVKRNSSYILTKEDSWTALTRLAIEVNWRCFCVNGVIYFVSEQWLFKSKPVMDIDESSLGIDWIDFDYDEGKKKATVTVTCHISRWSAPPGSIVKIKNSGLINGRWLVNDTSRSLYNTDATITLMKPLPVLPEPTSLATLPKGFEGPQEAPTGARNSAQPSVPQTQIQAAIVAYATSQLGVPYRWGAEQPGVAFDCSGLTQAAYNSVGIGIPKLAQDQYLAGPQVSQADKNALLPGDLVFFGVLDRSNPQSLHHVAIYIGNGAVIHAPHTGDVVRIQENFLSAFSDYYGATRPWQR